jgi:hypothetical protein
VPDLIVDEDRPFSMNLNASDPDTLIGLDALSFYGNSTDFPVSILGNMSFVPTNAQVGMHLVSVWVTDLAGLKSTCNFTITVVNVNDPPVITPVLDITVDEDTPVSFRVNASDEDAGDVISFRDDSSLVLVNGLGWVNFTPLQKDVGVHYVNITASDLSGANATFQMTITVRNVNDAPVNVSILAPQNGTRYTQGANMTFRGTASDVDMDKLTYTWYSDGQLLGTGQNLSTRTLKAGTRRIILKVSDGTLETSSNPLMIIIKAKEKPTTVPGFEPVLVFGALVFCAALLSGKRRQEWKA